MYTFSYPDFIRAFIEFEGLGRAFVEAQAMLAECENNFAGLCGDKQQCANWLYLAHNLTLRERQLDPCSTAPLTEVKSKNDTEKYLVSPELGGYGLSSTTYGVRLERLLKSCDFGISVNAMDCKPIYRSTQAYWGF